MSWLKIDEVAKQTGLTKRTIRFYEEMGLLSPPERSEGGVRRYTPEHVDHLIKVSEAKEVLGFSLVELQRFLELSGIVDQDRAGYRSAKDQKERQEKLADLNERLTEQLAMIEAKVARIREVQREMEDLRERVRGALKNGDQADE
ncbi:MerR family transcriptional regulator [Paenibacillus aurantius]|uniref:MerR family transcriptional regulator n=1 Tax=Paenibacillus aurantius TaxID=2918900 RepID=A0AA96LGF6_9BACL|nr:MerR family transcriptional regulator [Paenibacillus aurantius]WNQ12573.1 MerR family transcriptional regulator [Paenibacillus aurantius]